MAPKHTGLKISAFKISCRAFVGEKVWDGDKIVSPLVAPGLGAIESKAQHFQYPSGNFHQKVIFVNPSKGLQESPLELLKSILKILKVKKARATSKNLLHSFFHFSSVWR